MNRLQFYVLFFQLVLKWVALPVLVGLFLYFFLVVNNSHSGSTCRGCGQHVKYFEGMTGTSETTSPNKVNADGVVEYKQKDNGPGSPSQQAFRQQQEQQKKQNLNNTTFSP